MHLSLKKITLALSCFFAAFALFAQVDSSNFHHDSVSYYFEARNVPLFIHDSEYPQIDYTKNQKNSLTFDHITTEISDSIGNYGYNKKRLAIVLSSEAVLYGGSLYGLNALWYKNYPRSAFHFFNDNDEWLQMDKVGHMTTSYYIGRVGMGFMNWTGVARKKAIWYGGMLGSLYQTTIEVLDGYSSEWGFSPGDFAANTAGSFLCVGQQLAWNDQRIVLKYSFQQSPYAKYRPNVLGSDLQENLLKDYNGQIYWLSVNLYSFMSKDSKFPKWLNIAAGYGADGMTGGSFNPPYIDENGNQIYFDRYRQFYLSLDVDLTRIKTKSKFLKSVFYAVGFIKIPAPALQFSKHGVKGNLLGF